MEIKAAEISSVNKDQIANLKLKRMLLRLEQY